MNYYLIKELVKTEFKLKYYGSILGFFWSLLKPFLMLGILYFVFTYFLKTGIDKYALFLLLGITLWNYFLDTSYDSINSITSKKELLTKTKLSPSTLVITSAIHNAISLLLNLIVFFIIFFLGGNTLGFSALYFIFLLGILFLITTSISVVIIQLHVRFTDFKHIWDVITQMGFWVTPIVYGISHVSLEFQRWFLLNPFARIIIDSRRVILDGTLPDIKQILITIALTLIICIIAYYINKKNKQKIADLL